MELKSLENTGQESLAPNPSRPAMGATRRGKKRAFHRIPPMPVPVKALWESADEAARETAHGVCTAILETWVGKASRGEVAERLGMTRLRLWQLSQQGLAGMLAGLLKQPRARRGAGWLALPPEEDPMHLKRRIVQLERELKLAEDLIAVLREMPGNKDRGKERQPPVARKKPKRRRNASRRPATPGEKKAAEGVGREGSVDSSTDGGALAG